jgi:hypothetical protein
MPLAVARLSTLCLAAATLAALPAHPRAQDEPEKKVPWRMLLQQQIKAAKACDLLDVLTYQEFVLGDQKVLEGRVSCIDGREFTFTRRRPHQSFEFELCEPTVC